MVQPGKYQAKVEDYTVEEVNGNPVVKIYFDVDGKTVRYTGFLTPAAMERTLQSLAYCGLTGSLESVAEGRAGGALDHSTPVSITVDWQTDKNGVKSDKYTEVRWVNGTKKAKEADPTTVASAKTKLKALSGEWAKVKQDLGIKAKPAAAAIAIEL